LRNFRLTNLPVIQKEQGVLMTEHRYIVVEGPIGVGKTTLASKLAQSFGCNLLLEGAAENPFLPRFYDNPRAAALPTQLFFLLQRARQMQELRQDDLFNPVRVADFLMEKDRLFAQLTLDEHELALYEQVYQQLTLDAPRPDLVIYLQAPVDVLMARVQQRGVGYEKHIESGYLQRLADAYVEFFYHYSDAPLLIVNAKDIDVAGNERDYQQLLQRIQSIRSGRHYYNPAPDLLKE
jgi:deoxyguanosine kinase